MCYQIAYGVNTRGVYLINHEERIMLNINSKYSVFHPYAVEYYKEVRELTLDDILNISNFNNFNLEAKYHVKAALIQLIRS